MGIRELFFYLFGFAMLNGIVGYLAVISFLSRRQSINTDADMADFKSLARKQMYQALLQIVLLLGGIILGVVGLIMGKIGLLLIIILNGLIFVMGMICKGPENKTRSLPVDESLKDEYARVSHSWLHKPFPDF